MTFESYNIKEGQIMIAFSGKNLSVGTLNINPKQELTKHNRPVKESLFQLKGRCKIILFNKDNTKKETTLEEGESIDIPPQQYHIHSNPYHENSITFWKANGDITKIINDIRNNNHM